MILADKESEKQNIKYFFNLMVSYVLASITSLSIFFIGNNNQILPKIKNIYENTNILFFVLSILIFCVTFLICYLIMQRIKTRNLTILTVSDDLARTIISVLVLLFAFLIWIMSANSTSMLGYNEISKLPEINMLFALIAICLVVYSLRKILFKINIKSKLFWIILAISAASLTAYFFYAPNSLTYIYNFNVYYHSIYIHFQGTPFSENFLSIYGHYAIILRPLFLLIGLNPYTLAATTAMVGFVSIISVIYVMYNLVKNTFIRILGILVIIFPFVGFLPFQYPQAYPHRLLFPSLMMALAVILLKKYKQKNVFFILGYLLSSMAIIWNNDTGLICLATWGLLHIYITIIDNKVTLVTILKLLIPSIAIILSFILAWGIVNIYNVAIGGGFINLYYFLFPMLEKSYMYEILHADIPLYLTYWMPMILILLFFVGYAISLLPYFTKKVTSNTKPTIALFIAILGLGQFVYFMNRCAYFNILLGYYEVALLTLLITQMTGGFIKTEANNIKTIVNKLIFYCSMLAILGISLVLIVNIGAKIKTTSIGNDTTDLIKSSTVFEKTIEKDTPIIAISGASLGITLGWKNELDFIDLSDLFLNQHKEYIIHRLINYNRPFIIDPEYLGILQKTVCINHKDDCNKLKSIETFYNISNVVLPHESLSKYYLSQTMLYFKPKQ